MKKSLYSFLLALLTLAFIPAQSFAAAAPTPVAAPEDGDDDEDPKPYIEPAFTVYFNIDNADAVYVTINDVRVPHTAGENTFVIDPGDGYIKVHVNDGFVFTTFEDIDIPDRDARSFLQYDNQTMPVTVRKVINLGTEEGLLLDGHHFNIVTLDTSTLNTFTITVNVDDASKVEMVLGTGGNIESGSNRHVTLVDGVNTVVYNEKDTYLHFRSASFSDKIYTATFNDKNVVTDGAFWPTYTVPLKGSRTNNGVLNIVAEAPVVEDTYSFTANIDDPECVRYFTKMPIDRDQPFAQGDNTYTFSDGDYFMIWCTQQAFSCTLDGVELEFNDYTRTYRVEPSDGSVLVLQFTNPGPSFTISVDDASKVRDFMNTETYDTYTLVDGDNIIPLEFEGDAFRFRSKTGVTPYSFTINGTPKSGNNGTYNFVPRVGDRVEVTFIKPITDINYTITVDNADNVVVYNGNNPTNTNTINLLNGNNNLQVRSDNPVIRIAPKAPAFISSVTANNNTLEPDDEGIYTVTVTEGMNIAIASDKIEMDESVLLVIDNLQDVEWALMITQQREIEIGEGFNEIPFNTQYDEIMLFGFAVKPQKVYLNGVELEEFPDEENCYLFEPHDGDIVRVYFGEDNAVHDVTIDVADEAKDLCVIYRDLFQPVDHLAGFSTEPHGTYYVVIPTDEKTPLKVSVAANGPMQRPGLSAPVETEIEMEDGAFIFSIESPVTVKIAKKTSGIEDLGTEQTTAPVYNLQGIKVMDNATDADLRALPAGLYIHGNRKISVK